MNAIKSWLWIGVLCSGIALAQQPAAGQCEPSWLPGEGAPGVVGTAAVLASTSWDSDGDGPQPPVVVFGGSMLGAGDLAVSSVAAWDGTSWQALGDGLPAQVRALTVFNGDLVAAAGNSTFGGTGPANGVARWDGRRWQALSSAGFQNAVVALTVHNDALYAGGVFSSAGGTPAVNVARWDGATWHALGAGLPSGVSALTTFDGDLLAASNGIKRWNQRTLTWEPFGTNVTGSVQTFATYNGELFIGGSFHTSPGGKFETVARWDGAAWQPFDGDPDDTVFTLAEFHGDLIAGGIFVSVGGQATDRMARFDGDSWSPMPSNGMGVPTRRCDTLTVLGDELFAGGAVTELSGNQAAHVGRWNGDAWQYLGGGFDAIVYDFATYEGELIAGGWFVTAGDVVANGIARRDATGAWHTMGGVTGGGGFVQQLAVYDDVLLATGSFSAIDGVPAPGIAQWNGATSSWHAFGDTPVGELLLDDGALYAAGSFGSNRHVARWDPAAHDWVPIGTFPPNIGISCLTMFDGDLVAGGFGLNANVWRWDFDAPGTWQPVGQHLGFTSLETLGVFNGELLAGGYIDGGIVRFNGASWVLLGGGLFLGNESPDEVLGVFDLRVHNSELIVAGAFSYAGAQQYSLGAVPAFHVARWNGASWLGLGDGTNNAAVTLHEHEGDLIIGGWFNLAGGVPNGHWARWGSPCAESPLGDLDGSGAVDAGDLALLLGAWGPCGGCAADLTGDGVVDAADLAVLLGAWGNRA